MKIDQEAIEQKAVQLNYEMEGTISSFCYSASITRSHEFSVLFLLEKIAELQLEVEQLKAKQK